MPAPTLVAVLLLTVKAMPPEVVGSMHTSVGQKVLKELWPEIVDAYFRGLRGPSAKT